MTLSEFKDSIQNNELPSHLILQSLFYDAQGDWERAHDLVNDLSDPDSSWVHAYLHRKEGDLWNARYWYRRCGKEESDKSLDEEWNELAVHFLLKYS